MDKSQERTMECSLNPENQPETNKLETSKSKIKRCDICSKRCRGLKGVMMHKVRKHPSEIHPSKKLQDKARKVKGKTPFSI